MDFKRYFDNVTLIIAISTLVFSFIFFFKDTFFFFASFAAAIITTLLVAFTVIVLRWLYDAFP